MRGWGGRNDVESVQGKGEGSESDARIHQAETKRGLFAWGFEAGSSNAAGETLLSGERIEDRQPPELGIGLACV